MHDDELPLNAAGGGATMKTLAKRTMIGCAGLVLLWATSGCRNNPFAADNGKKSAVVQAGQPQPYEAQFTDLNRRASQLDANNRDLTTQLAQSQQLAQKQTAEMRDRVALLQKQLEDTARQLNETRIAKQEAEHKAETLQASVQKRGGAIITANNSVRKSLSAVQIPGLEVRQDDDVIRIELPTDQLFVQGSAQLMPGAAQLLDQAGDAISRNYSRQKVVVEGHSDATPTFNGTASNSHQLAAAQANAVFEALTQRQRLPVQQLSTMSHGSNHPRANNATPAGRAKNRRVELVIYPETIDGN